MGGKNHQPCRKYLPISTKMSREASLAFAHLELANVALEDIILAEIEGGTGTIKDIEVNLEKSLESLSQLISRADELKDEMDRSHYRDLHTLRPTINLDSIGTRLIDASMVSKSAWSVVAQNAKSGGFYKNLSMLKNHAYCLVTYTNKLGQRVRDLQPGAEKGMVTRVLEENLNGNLKSEFACLYQAWTQFQELFLASSLLSTEVYYAFNSYGSLVGITSHVSAA